MIVEMTLMVPGQRVGYFGSVVVDSKGYGGSEVFAAMDQLRSELGTARPARLVFDGPAEYRWAVDLAMSRTAIPHAMTDGQLAALVCDFFCVSNVVIEQAQERP